MDKKNIRNKNRYQNLHSNKEWSPPDINPDDLKFTIAESVLDEFVLGHDYSATLVELVQNEYDAEGRQITVSFENDSLRIKGDGRPIDAQGWQRLRARK